MNEICGHVGGFVMWTKNGISESAHMQCVVIPRIVIVNSAYVVARPCMIRGEFFSLSGSLLCRLSALLCRKKVRIFLFLQGHCWALNDLPGPSRRLLSICTTPNPVNPSRPTIRPVVRLNPPHRCTPRRHEARAS